MEKVVHLFGGSTGTLAKAPDLARASAISYRASVDLQ
jgi:hypothetical protein